MVLHMREDLNIEMNNVFGIQRPLKSSALETVTSTTPILATNKQSFKRILVPRTGFVDENDAELGNNECFMTDKEPLCCLHACFEQLVNG